MVAQLCEYNKNHRLVHFRWQIVWYVSYISIKPLEKNNFDRLIHKMIRHLVYGLYIQPQVSCPSDQLALLECILKVPCAKSCCHPLSPSLPCPYTWQSH